MIRALLLVLAVARATRFVTTDWLGHWMLVRPARRWALEQRDGPNLSHDVDDSWEAMDLSHGWATAPAPMRLVKGLDCAHCVGFHLGWMALLGELTIARLPVVGAIWRFGVTAFALSYVTGHLSSRLDG